MQARTVFDPVEHPIRGVVERIGPYEQDIESRSFVILLKGDPVVYRVLPSFPASPHPVGLTAVGDEVAFVARDDHEVRQMDFKNLTLAARQPPVARPVAPLRYDSSRGSGGPSDGPSDLD